MTGMIVYWLLLFVIISVTTLRAITIFITIICCDIYGRRVILKAIFPFAHMFAHISVIGINWYLM